VIVLQRVIKSFIESILCISFDNISGHTFNKYLIFTILTSVKQKNTIFDRKVLRRQKSAICYKKDEIKIKF